MAETRAVELNRRVDAFSAMLDGTYPTDAPPDLVHWWRCAKVAEESGEVIQALLAAAGENPRKARGDLAAVEKELLDVAFAALGAIAHLHGNEGSEVVTRLLNHARTTERRLAHTIEASA